MIRAEARRRARIIRGGNPSRLPALFIPAVYGSILGLTGYLEGYLLEVGEVVAVKEGDCPGSEGIPEGEGDARCREPEQEGRQQVADDDAVRPPEDDG